MILLWNTDIATYFSSWIDDFIYSFVDSFIFWPTTYQIPFVPSPKVRHGDDPRWIRYNHYHQHFTDQRGRQRRN